MSVLDLTLNEKELKPYWTSYSQEISSLLLSPTEIDSVDLGLNCLSIFSSKTVENSWYSTILKQAQKPNLPKTYYQSSIFSPVGSTDLENTVKISRKIQIYPNKEQFNQLNELISQYRFIYNKTVELFTKNKIGESCDLKTRKQRKTLSAYDIRDIFFNFWVEQNPWLSNCINNHTVKEAISEAMDALKIGFSQLKNKLIDKFELKFKSRKNPKQTIKLCNGILSKSGVLAPRSLNLKTPLIGEVNGYKGLKLTTTGGLFYLIYTVDIVCNSEVESQDLRIVALDPGVRTFQTMFSTDGFFGKVGEAAIKRLANLCHKADRIQRKIAKSKNESRVNYLRLWLQRTQEKIRNLRKELHHKVSKFLVDNFDVILLPSFEVSQMVKKEGRKINRTTTRSMLNLGHSEFRELLKYKANRYGKKLIIVSEAYTTKTVSWTGEIVEKVGGRKIIKSKEGITLDRDINGARGILVKFLTELPKIGSFNP